MQGRLNFPHKPLQPALGLLFRGQHVRKSGRMAKVDQQGDLLGGEAKQVFPLKVGNLHGWLANDPV